MCDQVIRIQTPAALETAVRLMNQATTRAEQAEMDLRQAWERIDWLRKRVEVLETQLHNNA